MTVLFFELNSNGIRKAEIVGESCAGLREACEDWIKMEKLESSDYDDFQIEMCGDTALILGLKLTDGRVDYLVEAELR